MIIPIMEYVVSPIIIAGLGYITWLLQTQKKQDDANARGTMLLLRREIIDAYNKFIKGGETMTAFCYEDIIEIHDAYKALGGNGLTDSMYEELMKLKIN